MLLLHQIMVLLVREQPQNDKKEENKEERY